MFKIAKNVIIKLEKIVKSTSPARTTKRGSVFIPGDIPMSVIELTVPFKDYLEYLKSLSSPVRPKMSEVIFVGDQTSSFQVVILGQLVESNGDFSINGRKVEVI
mgnify:CR=1